MAIAYLGYTYSEGVSTTTSPYSLDTTGATLLVISVAWYSVNSITVSDSKGNTWTSLTIKTQGNISHQIFYAANPSVGTGHEFTISGTSIYFSSILTAFSGVATSSPFDQQNGATATSASTLSTGSVTPSQDNELVVAAIGFEDNSSGAVSINGGFTIAVTRPFIGGAAQGTSQAYLIQTSAASANPQWNITNAAAELAAGIATFKAATGGGGTKAMPLFHRSTRLFCRSF